MKQILITGIPRSGTSIVAEIISLCGIQGGQVNSMFENTYLQGYFRNVLSEKGYDINGHHPLPPIDFTSLEIRKQMEMTWAYQGVSGDWYYKDCRILLFCNQFITEYPEAEYILIRRTEKNIIESCKKTGYMNVFDDFTLRTRLGIYNTEQGWKYMIGEYNKRMEYLKNKVKVTEIWLEDNVNAKHTIPYMMERTGITINKDIYNNIYSLIDKKIKI